MAALWDYSRLCNEIIGDQERCIQWCEKKQLIPTELFCCEGHKMKLKTTDSYIGYFVCSKKHANGKLIRFTRYRGTVFETRRMPPEKFLTLVYCFASNLSYRNTVIEYSMEGSTVSKNTVQECFTFCRELLTYYYLECFKDSPPVGTTGKCVEIVELVLSHRKFKFGSCGEGTIVVFFIEQETSDFAIEISTSEDYNSQILHNLIRKNVKKGSILLPHMYRDFTSLSENGEYFVLSIEADNHCSKKFEKLASAGVDKLVEHLFRTSVKKKNSDVFEEFINIIKAAYPIQECV